MVTSSAVVGSSAISSLGPEISAEAIITRWHIPPDNSAGNCPARRSGSGMPTRRSISSACRSASRLEAWPCTIRLSATWAPTAINGLSEAIGSWKIIDRRRPRTARISASPFLSRSAPSSSTSPAVAVAAAGSSRITESAVRLLPEPLSPTSATTSPGLTSSETWSTTARPSISVTRSRTESTGGVRSASAKGRPLDRDAGPRIGLVRHAGIDADARSRLTADGTEKLHRIERIVDHLDREDARRPRGDIGGAPGGSPG